MTDTTDKMNHGLGEDISSTIDEYLNLNYINPSPDPDKRANKPKQRETDLKELRKGLEGVINAIGGKGAHERPTALNIIDRLVEEAYQRDSVYRGVTLPSKEAKKEREMRISDYLRGAGVTQEDIAKAIVNLNGPIDLEALQPENPLRRLVDYIITQQHTEQKRFSYIQQRLAELDATKSSEIAVQFNKKAGMNLDPRYAKVNDILQAYGLKLQGRNADYEANDPTKLYNKGAAAGASVAHAGGH